MSLETANFQLPYPELPDSPNVPADMLALVTRLDDVLQQLQDQVFLPQKVMGRLGVPNSTGSLKVPLPFQPVRVRIKTVYTQATDPPNYSDSNSLHYNEGVAGLDINGNLVQWLQAFSTQDLGGIGSAVRVLLGSCAGLSLGGAATPVGRAQMTSLDIDGFTMNVVAAAPDAVSYEYWWEADQ